MDLLIKKGKAETDHNIYGCKKGELYDIEIYTDDILKRDYYIVKVNGIKIKGYRTEFFNIVNIKRIRAEKLLLLRERSKNAQAF